MNLDAAPSWAVDAHPQDQRDWPSSRMQSQAPPAHASHSDDRHQRPSPLQRQVRPAAKRRLGQFRHSHAVVRRRSRQGPQTTRDAPLRPTPSSMLPRYLGRRFRRGGEAIVRCVRPVAIARGGQTARCFGRARLPPQLGTSRHHRAAPQSPCDDVIQSPRSWALAIGPSARHHQRSSRWPSTRPHRQRPATPCMPLPSQCRLVHQARRRSSTPTRRHPPGPPLRKRAVFVRHTAEH